MVKLNQYVKLVCLFAVITLALVIPNEALWAGTTGKISGTIVDKSTNEALPGVNVVIVGTAMGASTNAKGEYFILGVPPGTYSLRATMIGYGPVVQKNVVVNVDRTTTVNFELSQAVLEMGKEIVVTATRPLVETDVSSSQIVTTSEQASTLPAAQIIQTIALEPGIEIDNLEEIRIRGGGGGQISFQVDGMERMDRLNTRAYTQMNAAAISEVQILTGGFNAEYGNIRSGIFNVITKEGGKIVSGAIDYRFGPPQQKHFGPSAYGKDQYDWKLYAGPNSFNEIKDVEGNVLWQGWNKRTETLNQKNYLGKNDWKPEEILEIWKWRHRGVKYADKPDHYLDAGVGGPLTFLEALGMKEAGYFFGYKYTKRWPTFPMLSGAYTADIKEGKVSMKPTSSIKVVFNGMYGVTHTTTNGNSWNPRDLAMRVYHDGENLATTATGVNKYYLWADALLNVYTKQLGAKIIHTLSPSTYYEIRFNSFMTESKAGRGRSRSPRTFGVKKVDGIWLDETPYGWVDEAMKEPDLTGAYMMGGGGRVRDTSNVVTQKINFDITSQVNSRNLVKAGLEAEFNDIERKYERIEEIQLLYGEWVSYHAKPRRYAAYIQDKLEYGGMIANIGVRLDYFDANGYIYVPNDIYSPVFARGGTEGYRSPDDLPKEKSKSYLYVSPRLGISHPVRQNTKFFFNYGTFYSEPPTRNRYGFYSEHRPFGDPQGDVRWVGYANLKPPRTVMYEVGFEQSFMNTYLARASFYSKNNTDQIGSLRVDGVAGSHNAGDFRNFVSVGKGAAGYNTPRNNQYEDIRGIEFKLSKLRGDFVTGWLNFEYAISTRGYYGIQRLNQDPLVGYYIYSAVQQRPEPIPKFIGNLDFHTPPDWGKLKGNWRLSVLQRWNIGPKVIWNPEGLPTREVRTVYHWIDYYNTSLRLTKTLHLGGNNLLLYMDVSNLFNFRYLNWAALNNSERETYITNVVDPTNGLGNKIGDYKDKDGNNVFTDNWVDKDGAKRAPIAPSKDFALFLNPRLFLFGVKLEF